MAKFDDKVDLYDDRGSLVLSDVPIRSFKSTQEHCYSKHR